MRDEAPRTPRAWRPTTLPATVAALVLLATLSLGTVAAAAAEKTLEDFSVGNYPLGGPFTLTDQDGGTTRLADFRGQVVLLAFGYTHCPDVCPMTLAYLTNARKALGAQAARVQGVFITVDPTRDTPGRLKAYLSHFDPTLVGLTGTQAEVAQVAKAFGTRYKLRNEDGQTDYRVDHTAFTYVLDGAGKVRYLLPFDADPGFMAKAARALLQAGS